MQNQLQIGSLDQTPPALRYDMNWFKIFISAAIPRDYKTGEMWESARADYYNYYHNLSSAAAVDPDGWKTSLKIKVVMAIYIYIYVCWVLVCRHKNTQEEWVKTCGNVTDKRWIKEKGLIWCCMLFFLSVLYYCERDTMLQTYIATARFVGLSQIVRVCDRRFTDECDILTANSLPKTLLQSRSGSIRWPHHMWWSINQSINRFIDLYRSKCDSLDSTNSL